MSKEFVITNSSIADGEMVTFGPLDQTTMTQLTIPKSMTRIVNYPELELEIELTCAFSGQRLEVTNMNIKGHGTYIATRTLTQLSLPLVIHEIAYSAIPNITHWTKPRPELLDKNRAFLAQLYWLEHVSWGTPRTAIMELKKWSRPNTSFHIQNIAKEYELPGAHSKQKASREVSMEELIEATK